MKLLQPILRNLNYLQTQTKLAQTEQHLDCDIPQELLNTLGSMKQPSLN